MFIFQAGSSPVSSISGFSVGSSGKIDEDNEVEDFLFKYLFHEFKRRLPLQMS